MDKLELVNKLRTGAFLARVTIRAPTKGADGVPDDTYTKLASAQRDVRDTLQTRSVAFGDKRLVFNEDFLDMVHTMGQPMSDFIGLLATLPEDKRSLFAIDRSYEPVPAPDGFGLLPEAVTTSLARHVEDRVCKLYYAGLDDTVTRLHTAVDFFIKRVTEYHATQGSGTRAVMRSVVLTDVVDLRALLARTNLVNSPAINDLDAALAGAVQYSADEIRKSPEKRIAALDAAKAAQQQLAAYNGA